MEYVIRKNQSKSCLENLASHLLIITYFLHLPALLQCVLWVRLLAFLSWRVEAEYQAG